MKRTTILLAALAGSLFIQGAVNAQTVATDPVGFVQPFSTSPNLLANSDTHVSVPFTRPPEFVGATSSATANTLTVSGSPWVANQFVYVAGTQPKTYFVLVGPHASTNPKEGRTYTVTSNTANQLTVNTGGDDLSTVAANTQILVVPYQTLSTIFPASDVGVSFVQSTNFVLGLQTSVLIPNYSGTGINLAPTMTYAFINGAWRLFGQPVTDNHGDDALPNAGYFIVRNKNTGTTLTTLGSVLTKKTTTFLLTRVAGAQDNFVSVVRPVDVQLNDLGLITSNAFVASTNFVLGLKDSLLVFNPAQAQTNKAPAVTYAYINNAWRKFGQPLTTDFGTDTIPAGAGFIIRKAATATGASVPWTNTPTY